MKKKFDYSEAKKLENKRPGKCIVTNTGLPVKILSFEVSDVYYPICAETGCEVHQFNVYGRCKDSDTMFLELDVPAPKPKKPIMVKCSENIEHTFKWHPVTQIPEELESPVIFLTDKGRMVTHGNLKGRNGHNLFHSYACYSNAVAWVYQKELFDIEDFQ